MIKPAFRLLPLAFLMLACDRSENAAAAKPPKAEVVDEDATQDSATPEAALKALPVPEEGVPARAPRAIAVSEDEALATPPPASTRQPRARTIRAAEEAGQGLQTAGRKTEEAAVVAEEHTKDAVEIAREKTETGIRNATGATGRFLQKAGEKIEEAAKDAEKP